MEFYVCRNNRILSPLSKLEAELEAFAIEPITHIGYCVIAVDDDDFIHELSIKQGQPCLEPLHLPSHAVH